MSEQEPTNASPSMPPAPQGAPAEPTPPAAKPSKKGLWIAVAVLIVALGGVGAFVAMSGDDGEGEIRAGNSYSEHGVTFSYPSGWRSLGAAQFTTETGDSEWSDSFFHEDGVSAVIVTEYALLQDVSGVDQEQLQAELQGLFDSSLWQAGGEVVEALAPSTVNGVEGFRIVFTTPVDGIDTETDMVMVFEGTRQFNLQCQYTPETEEEVMAGCDQVRSSFVITG